METFAPIEGYDDMYGISVYGNIISFKRGKLLKLNKNTSGYYQVGLFKDGKRRIFRVHQLVAINFIDKNYLSKGLFVDHIDRNRVNNIVDNLRCVTPRENSSFIRGKVDKLGVGYSKNAFTCHIVVGGVSYNLGRFTNKEDAHKKYLEALSCVKNGTFCHDDLRKNKKSIFRGIYYSKRDCYWIGKVQHNGKRITVGYEKDKDVLLLKMIAYRELHNIKI